MKFKDLSAGIGRSSARARHILPGEADRLAAPRALLARVRP